MKEFLKPTKRKIVVFVILVLLSFMITYETYENSRDYNTGFPLPYFSKLSDVTNIDIHLIYKDMIG